MDEVGATVGFLALTDEPQSTTAWSVGAVGEERLGSRLNGLASPTMGILHDRRLPGGRANIDHIVVARSGVYVIDAKKYSGRPRLVVEGGIFRSRVEKLFVGTRDRTTLVDGVLKQVGVVRAHVGRDVPVHGVLCFVEADWPLIGGSFVVRNVKALWPRKLEAELKAPGELTVDEVADIHRRLAVALPAA